MREAVESPGAPAAVGSYSQAVRAGRFLFVSGQTGLDPATGRVAGDVGAQTARALESMAAIAREAGATLDHMVHCRVALADMAHFPAFDAVYRRHLSPPYPARMTVGAALYEGLAVEMEAVFHLPEA